MTFAVFKIDFNFVQLVLILKTNFKANYAFRARDLIS